MADVDDVKETIDKGFKGLYEAQEEAKKAADQEFETLKKRLATVEGVGDKLIKTEKWLSDVEARVNTARTHGQNSDGLMDAIPAEYRRHVDMAVRLGYKDPAETTARCLWWHYQFMQTMALRQNLGRTPGEYRTMAENLEKAWGYDPRVTKSLSEGTTTQGGFVVATPVEAELYRLIRDNTIVRPLATKIVMTGPTHQIPSEANNVTAYIIAESGTVTESTQLTASQFSQIPLVAKKFGGFATISNELLQDNIIGLQDYLFTAIAEHIGILEDQGALDGSTNFTGLDKATGVNSFSTATTGTDGGNVPYFNELVKTVYFGQQAGSRMGARFFMHPYAFKNIMGLVDTTGQPVFMFGQAPQAVPQFIGGYPVSLVSSLSRTLVYKTSSTNIYFGPPSKIIFGDIAGMQFDIDPFSLFQKVLTNVRVIKRTGIAIAVPSAFTILHGVKHIVNEGSGAPGT